MRFQLKHVLPVALFLTGVIAADSSDSGTASATKATEKASATDDSATATGTGDSKATGTSDASATGDSSTASDKGKTTAKASVTTPKSTYTDTWTAVVPSTTAPDLESSSFSLKDNNYIIVSLSLGLLTAGINLL